MSRTNPLYQSAISPRFGLLDGMLLLVIINLDIDSIEYRMDSLCHDGLRRNA